MPAEYCTVLGVMDKLRHTEESSEDFTSVSGGDTLDLTNKYLIPNAFPTDQNSELSSDQTVIVLKGGTVQSTSDYDVDKRDGSITWNGSDGVDLTVRYKHMDWAPQHIIDLIEEEQDNIDDELSTIFNGTKTVTDEIYDGLGTANRVYIFDKRPVDVVESVEVNDAQPGDPDDWVTMDKGRAKDYIVKTDIGIQFVTKDVAPRDEPANLRVTYDYGYSNVPKDIRDLCKLRVAHSLLKDEVASANAEGKDNFDPETVDTLKSEYMAIQSRWKRPTIGGTQTLAEEGTIS